ncbi:HD domain-containing protein [Streptomyces sp. YJ-C3]
MTGEHVAREQEVGPGQRRALLIGVTQTPYLADHPELSDRYRPLDSAERDVTLLRAVLEDSGYDVETRTKSEETGHNPVLGAVSRFFASCAPGDTAFLYFSCHGETLGGIDHLVLADTQADWPLPDGTPGLDPDTLLRADPDKLLRRLPPGVTAVICLDICRTPEPREAQPGPADRGTVPGGHQAYWVYSCGSGQRSYADPMAGSWFARALADALSPLTPPRSFHEVIQHTQAELIRISDDHPQVEAPEVQFRRPSPIQDEPDRDPAVCEGSEQSSEWIRAIRDSTLWKHTSGPAEAHRRVQDRLADLVRCVVGSAAGSGALRDDPWSDPLYPVRVEDRLADLVGRAGPLRDDELLSPAETACLLAAAVVQEGIVAVALDELRGLLPVRFDPGPRGKDEEPGQHRRLVRDAARDVCRAHSLVLRTTETLRGRGLDDAAKAADHWLRHRFVADWDRLWFRMADEYRPVDELIDMVVQAVVAAADSPAAGPRTDADREQIDNQVRQVLGHTTVKPGRSPRINFEGHGEDWIESWPVRGNQWRGPQLARLLWTASLLAADPRRLSSVLVDHLGAHEPLVARDVAVALRGFDYDAKDRSDGTYALAVRFRCPHPALHAAVEELALTADAAVRAFREDPALPVLLQGLPSRVTTDQLTAVPGRYKEPLERFRLAEDEIRPLLMGTQLYGDRMLAVRELYQNALDACRYRDMRRQYGKARSAWDGEITFVQGRHDGRPYIECTDNGSGMTRNRLTSMFARAGKRYEQDPEFVQERRNWRREGITDRSMNSRFGIGVFSYFMLADEVVVWTRPVDQFGIPGADALRADIQSGSGLLQINTSRDAEVPEGGGTRVRLYLAEAVGEEKRASALETLRTLLWVTEHQVHAEELADDGSVVRSLDWVPGQLVDRDEWYGDSVPLGPEADADAWLVQGKGQLLLDGIVVQDAPKVYGYVVNLRERHAPVPSVDRKQLLSYDTELVMTELVSWVQDAGPGVGDVSLSWLWQLGRTAPRLTVALLDSLPRETVGVIGPGMGHMTRRLEPGRVLLSETGCLPCGDGRAGYVSVGPPHPHQLREFRHWRNTLLDAGKSRQSFTPSGYPTPQSIDTLLFRHAYPHGWEPLLQAAAQGRICVRTVLRAVRRYAVTGIHVPAVADIRALEGVRISQAAADLRTAYLSLEHDMHRLADVDGYAYRRSARALERQRPPAQHAPLLEIAAVFSLTLGQTADLLRELRLLEPTLPEPPELDEALSTERPTLDDASRLAVRERRGLSYRTPSSNQLIWHPGSLGPVALFVRATPPFSPSELAQRIEHFAPLGFSLEPALPEKALDLRELPPEQRLLLSHDFDGSGPWYEGDVPLEHLMELSHQTGASLKEVAERIDAAQHITAARAPAIPEAAADWVVPSWVGRALRDRSVGRRSGSLRPWELFSTWTDFNQPATFLRALGVLDASALVDWGDGDRALLECSPESLQQWRLPEHYARLDVDFDAPNASLAFLMAAAHRHGEALGTAGDQLARLKTLLPLKPIDLPEPARGLRVSAHDLEILAPRALSLQASQVKRRLRVLDLLEYGLSSHTPLGETVQHLAEYVPIGGPALPGPFEGPHAERLQRFVPEWFDISAFAEDLLGPAVLGPLELVLVSGRFGWSLAKTYDRYAPFACLGLDVTVHAPQGPEGELVPDWRDVVLLTEQLTGRAPALSGDVPQDHITLCVEETDLDEDGVRERLSQYANLFGLTLPAETDDMTETAP